MDETSMLEAYILEKYLIEPKQWDDDKEWRHLLPKVLIKSLDKPAKSSPIGLGKHPESGWFVLACGQGPFIVWAQWDERTHQAYEQKKPDGWKLVVKADGSRVWYMHDKKHREKGPAVVRPDGTRIWLHRGYQHRGGGLPSFLHKPSGRKEWWEMGTFKRSASK